MSCNGKSNRCAAAARRNGIWGVANKYLNTLGNPDTYQGLNSADQVPVRMEQVTTAFLGLTGLNSLRQGRWPRLTGDIAWSSRFGAQVLEQATGNLATVGLRLLRRGQPVAKYRGVIIRSSPFTRQPGGRVKTATGYYFHEGGRSWHAESVTYDFKGTSRTLTRVKSFGLPYREHYFDRPLTLGNDSGQTVGDDREQRSLYMQRVIDVAKGDEDPAAIPGYIGSTNELENLTPLADVKRAFFMTNWFLVDESERDDPAANNTLLSDANLAVAPATPAKAAPDYYQLKPATPIQTAQTAQAADNPYRQQIEALARQNTTTPPPAPVRPAPLKPANPAQQAAAATQQRWRFADGQEYPVNIGQVIRNPITKKYIAKNAMVLDGNEWRYITDNATLEALGQAVSQGQLKLDG